MDDVKALLNDICELHEALEDANLRVSLAESKLREAFPELDGHREIEPSYRTKSLGTAWIALEDCWGISDDVITECEELSERLRNLLKHVIE